MQRRSKQKPKVVTVAGPTSSGKSDLAVIIAQRFNGEVISADSRQVYRGMDIGSGKVPISYKPNGESKKLSTYYKGIRHHLLDVASPKRTFTVAQYQKHAKKALKDILKRNKLPVVCGGTGLYIDALIYDYKFPAVPPQKKLRAQLEKKTTAALLAELKKRDPERAQEIDQNNRRRLIRALEITLITGKPITRLKKSSPYNLCLIGIKYSEEKLKKRIEERLRQRLKQGMVEEVVQLHNLPIGKGVSWQKFYDFGLEYRYISLYLQKKLTKEEMINEIERGSRHYAKRQMTWLKRNKNIHWVTTEKEALTFVKQFTI